MKKTLIFVLSILIISFFPFAESTKGELTYENQETFGSSLVVTGGNSLISVSQPVFYNQPTQRMRAVITAYSSSPDETWGDPFIMASGRRVYEGAIACPAWLSFGTIVEISGRQYVCEDRMNIRFRDSNRFDIWKTSKQAALTFGIQKAYVDVILEN